MSYFLYLQLMNPLCFRMANCALNSLAASSKLAYEQAWKCFRELAGNLGVNPLLVSAAGCENILATLAHSSQKFHTVKTNVGCGFVLSPTKWVCSANPKPCCKTHHVRNKEILFVKLKRATLLSGALVMALLGEDLWCTSYYDVSMKNWRTVAMIMLSFSVLCRFHYVTNISVINISFEGDKVKVFIAQSKTDQFGEGQLVSLLATGGEICLVKTFFRI